MDELRTPEMVEMGVKPEKKEPDDEIAYELYAAFGPGETIVNVITGERYHT